jgi:hypothetical protein
MHGSEGDEKRHYDDNCRQVVLTCLPYKRSVAGSIPAGRVKQVQTSDAETCNFRLSRKLHVGARHFCAVRMKSAVGTVFIAATITPRWRVLHPR